MKIGDVIGHPEYTLIITSIIHNKVNLMCLAFDDTKIFPSNDHIQLQTNKEFPIRCTSFRQRPESSEERR